MTTRISPERARELREGAQPGPWVYNRPIVETNGGRGLLTAADPEYGVIDEGDGPLVAAAPELAETIAGMHWEYAMQGLDDYGVWRFSDFTGRLLFAHETDRTSWYREPITQKHIERIKPGWRIVRRMVTDPEVVE